jgi:hypothetical protein
MIFIPEEESEYHPVIHCIFEKFFKDSKNLTFTQKKFIEKFKRGCIFKGREKADDLKALSCVFNINFEVYRIQNKTTHNIIQHEQTINNIPKSSKTISLITQRNGWGFLLENRRGKLKLLDRYFCNVCSNWIPYISESLFLKNHQQKCIKCLCGRCYKEGDAHPTQCNQQWEHFRSKEKLQKLEIKRLKRSKSKKGSYMDHQYFSDFECFPDKRKNYQVYAAGIIGSKKNDKFEMLYGENTMKEFMEKLLTLKGILWFFNGSRFDCYFIMKYCIINGIPIDQEQTMISNNQILVLGLITNGNKRLLIKDFAKFVTGSLAFNCKTLGVGSDQSKSSFDHSKVKSWEDAEKHKKEVEEYLRLDVIALKAIYENFSKEIWDNFQVNTCTFISLAQLGFGIFTLDVGPELLFRIPVKDITGNLLPYEGEMREAYRGGRLVMTRPAWKSDDYDDIIKTNQGLGDLSYFFKKPKNSLMYVDKNSLYPSVMNSDLYPCGTFERFEVSERRSEVIIQLLIKEAEIESLGSYELEGDKNEDPQILKLIFTTEKTLIWKYRLIKVDLICPKDIYIGFIMDRDQNKKNIQNLEDKKGIWLTGGEILEAIIIGYNVTRVYAYYSWTKLEPIFKHYIEYTNRKKSLADKDTAPYQTAKTLSNAVSGKFGQIVVDKLLSIYIGDDINYDKVLRSNQNNIYSDGELLAAYCERDTTKTNTDYPLQFSVFILANARVSMSRFTRLIDGYRNPKNVPIYGDTDSLVFDKSAIEGIDKIQIGKHLGQMKDEMPHAMLFAQYTLAPKTNMKIYIVFDKESGKYVIRVCFKSKGIPHIRDEYDPFLNYEISTEESEKIIKIAQFLEDRAKAKKEDDIKDLHYDGYVELGRPLFIRQNFGEERKVVKDRLTWDDVECVMRNTCNIVCLYGGMIRNLKDDADVDRMGIYPDYMRRSLSKQNWWENGKNRIVDDFPFGITKPIGFSLQN